MRVGYLFLIYSCILALTPAFADDQDSGLTFPSEYRFTIIQPAKGSGETGNSGVERIRVPEGEFLIKRSQDAPAAEETLPESAITANSHTPDIKPDIDNMVLVPEGEAIIGLPEGVPGSDRNPLRTLAFKTFLIDKYEVTNVQYKKCVETGGCNLPSLIVDYPPTLHQEGKDWYKDSAKDD